MTTGMQITNMRFDPVTGKEHVFPANAQHYRMYNTVGAVWMFNPWTGTKRDPRDVDTDKYGVLIVPTGEPLMPTAPTWPNRKHNGVSQRRGMNRRVGDTAK